jgi:hypothetical protein
MDYTDLRNKTIFDFTTDKKLIKEITGFSSKDKYLEEFKDFPHDKGIDLQILAEKTNNEELLNAVEKEFGLAIID